MFIEIEIKHRIAILLDFGMEKNCEKSHLSGKKSAKNRLAIYWAHSFRPIT